MAQKYGVGDKVQLKSGGPEMTVKALPSAHRSYYICQWFAGKKLEQGEFPEGSIKAVEPEA